jgi:hypothetical protein
MPKRRKQYDPYAEFRAKTKDEQRESILDIAAFCIDGATVGLARRIEIYFDVTEEQQEQRHMDIRVRNNMGP